MPGVAARVDKAVEELLPLLQTSFPVASNDTAAAERVRDAFSDIVTREDLSHKDALAYLDNRRLFKQGFGDAFGPRMRELFETIVRLKAFTGVARRLNLSTRTLHRRLEDRGLNFNGMLRETRFRLAKHYLGDVRLDLNQFCNAPKSLRPFSSRMTTSPSR